MAFFIAAILLIVFIANVAVGALTGSAWFGIVTEMVLLFCASIAFTAAILKREAAARRDR